MYRIIPSVQPALVRNKLSLPVHRAITHRTAQHYTHLEVAVQDHFRVPLPARSPSAVIALFEHIVRRRVEHPVASFAATDATAASVVGICTIDRLAAGTSTSSTTGWGRGGR